MADYAFILAFGGDAIEAIVAVIVMLLFGLGHFLKKRSEGDDKDIIIPTAEQQPQHKSPPPQARAPSPAQPPTARTAAQVFPRPQARPTQPTATPRSPQRQSTRLQPPLSPRPAAPATLQQTTPRRTQPRPTARPTKRERATPMEHAAQIAARAEHVAHRLQEQRLREKGLLKPGEHPQEEQTQRPSPSRQLIELLNHGSIKQAILLSEILQPPLAMRDKELFP